MASRKGFGLFSRVINPKVLSPDRNWYVLSHAVCGNMSPAQFWKQSYLVSSFPEEFCKVEIVSLMLVDGSRYKGKASSAFEVVASSLGLLAILLCQQSDATLLENNVSFVRLRALLSGIELSSIENEDEASAESMAHRPQSRATRQLKMAGSSVETPMTPPLSDSKAREITKSSPTLKEISERGDLDTPEKLMMIEKRGKRVIQDLSEVCDKHREMLLIVLSYLCAFGDPEAKAILNEIID